MGNYKSQKILSCCQDNNHSIILKLNSDDDIKLALNEADNASKIIINICSNKKLYNSYKKEQLEKQYQILLTNYESLNMFKEQNKNKTLINDKILRRQQKSLYRCEDYFSSNNELIRTECEQKLIREYLKNNQLTKNLSSDDIKLLTKAIRIESQKKGEQVVVEGEQGNDWYIIKEGNASCYSKKRNVETKIKVFKKGESFGDLSLIYDCRRSASVKADTDLELQVLDKENFRTFIMAKAQSRKEKMEQILANVSLFKYNLDLNDRAVIGDAFEEATFPKNHIIFAQGDEITDDSKFQVIASGQLVILIKDDCGKEIFKKYMWPGQFFGESGIMKDTKRTSSIMVIEESTLIYMNKKTFLRNMDPILHKFEFEKENF